MSVQNETFYILRAIIRSIEKDGLSYYKAAYMAEEAHPFEDTFAALMCIENLVSIACFDSYQIYAIPTVEQEHPKEFLALLKKVTENLQPSTRVSDVSNQNLADRSKEADLPNTLPRLAAAPIRRFA